MNELTWTWIAGSNSTDQVGVYGEKGIASTDNYPGARAGAAGWYDSLRQEFWLFGGYGYARAVSSDGASTYDLCIHVEFNLIKSLLFVTCS